MFISKLSYAMLMLNANHEIRMLDRNECLYSKNQPSSVACRAVTLPVLAINCSLRSERSSLLYASMVHLFWGLENTVYMAHVLWARRAITNGLCRRLRGRKVNNGSLINRERPCPTPEVGVRVNSCSEGFTATGSKCR